MKVSKVINLPTYSCNLTIVITDQIKSESKKIYKKHELGEDDEEEENEGLLITSSDANYFLVLDIKYLTHNTIAHEIYHATVRITEDRNVVDEEAQAWLCGHITTEMYKFIEKKKLVVTHGRR
jgi:hypothetical protein